MSTNWQTFDLATSLTAIEVDLGTADIQVEDIEVEEASEGEQNKILIPGVSGSACPRDKRSTLQRRCFTCPYLGYCDIAAH